MIGVRTGRASTSEKKNPQSTKTPIKPTVRARPDDHARRGLAPFDVGTGAWLGLPVDGDRCDSFINCSSRWDRYKISKRNVLTSSRPVGDAPLKRSNIRNRFLHRTPGIR